MASQTDPATIYTSVDASVYTAAAHGAIIDAFEEKRDELVNILTPNKNSVLHINITASKADDTGFIEHILTVCPALLQQQNAKGETPLHLAARYGRADVARLLVEHAKADLEDSTQMVRAENGEGDTALHEAVRFRHLSIVKVLTGEDPGFSSPVNKAGETPLYIACERKYRELVCVILDNCASPASAGPCGRTALHAATISKDEDSLKKILQKMPHLTRKGDDNGWIPLHYATDLKYISITRILLKSEAEAVYAQDKRGKTALHVAALRGHHKILSELLKSRPDSSELVDDRGCNILHSAVESDDKKTVVLILDNPQLSHLIYAKNKDGNTPLHHAATLLRGKSLRVLTDDKRRRRVDKDAFNDENRNVRDIVFNEGIRLDKVIIRNWFSVFARVNFGKRILERKDESTNFKLDNDGPRGKGKYEMILAAMESTWDAAPGSSFNGKDDTGTALISAPDGSPNEKDDTVLVAPQRSRDAILVVATALVSSGTSALLQHFNLPSFTIWALALFFVVLFVIVSFLHRRKSKRIRKQFYYRITGPNNTSPSPSPSPNEKPSLGPSSPSPNSAHGSGVREAYADVTKRTRKVRTHPKDYVI